MKLFISKNVRDQTDEEIKTERMKAFYWVALNYPVGKDEEIEVIENEVSGIKIRNTSLEKKECIKLPAGCVVNKNNN